MCPRTPFVRNVADEDEDSNLRVLLDDGYAERMGDGMFISFQTVDRIAQSVGLSADDLRLLIGGA